MSKSSNRVMSDLVERQKQIILQNGVSNVSEFLHPPPKRLIHERAHVVLQI